MSSGGKMPAPKPVPIPQPPPTLTESQDVRDAMVAERRMRAARGGRASTLLAGTSDVQMPAAGKTLLGS